MRIWIATGGTGGHIFPALAVATALTKQHKLTISTDGRGAAMVAKHKPTGATIARVWASGVGGRNPVAKAFALFKIVVSSAALFARFLILRPARIVAFGGYASVPAVLAGRALGIPVFLHEQNAHAGRANALSAKFANKILTSFPQVNGLPKNAVIEYTGLPVRADFKPAPYIQTNTIFITGGSLGATILREVVPSAINMLPGALKKNLMIVQQVDSDNIAELEKFYTKNGIKHRLASFFHDMASEITNASLVIGRSGASTIVEIMTIGRPAIFVPLTINPDQLANARAFEKLGAGITIQQKNFTPKLLSHTLADLLENPARLKKMAQAAQTENNAVANIIHAIL